MNATAIVDAWFGFFGYARARFSPEGQVLDAVYSVLDEFGAVKCGEEGMPTAYTHYLFLVRGRKVKLTVEDDQDTILTGPKAIVQELYARISERQSTR